MRIGVRTGAGLTRPMGPGKTEASERGKRGMTSLPLASAGVDPVAAPTSSEAERDWVDELSGIGPVRDAALADVHRLMVRAARHQVGRMRHLVAHLDPRSLDDLANGAADVALTALLVKLSTFEGRSRFTTWAYKFAILEAATAVRRETWSGREVAFDDIDLPDGGPAPEEEAEAGELAAALRRAMTTVLTPHQRRIATSLLLDGVPIDVLADRLGTTRGALYKTLHVARTRLRNHLAEVGILPARMEGDPR